MTRHAIVASLTLLVLAAPLLAFGEEQVVVSPKDKTTSASPSMPVFPPSENCTSSSPCRHVVGEILRVEESYWIKQPNGNEMHLKATKDSKLEKLPKVGDKIAAQITSRGEVEALKKIKEFPKENEIDKPDKTLGSIR
jgi:hypothetical protein